MEEGSLFQRMKQIFHEDEMDEEMQKEAAALIRNIFRYKMCIRDSHAIEFRSRWLVGSSRSKMSGFVNRSLPRDTRVFCPPERVSTGLVKSFSVNPSPFNTPVISLSQE